MAHNGRRLFLSDIMNNNICMNYSTLLLKVKDVDKFTVCLTKFSRNFK